MSNEINNIGTPSGRRDLALDVLKGIAIITVVYTHTWPFCKNFIRMFCLPIFFVTSGYCFKSRINTWADWRKYMKRRFQTIYIPCAVYNGFFALLTTFFLRIGIYTDNPEFLKMTAGWPVPQKLHVVNGIGDILIKFLRVITLTDTTQVGTGTWFFIALFCISALHATLCCLTAKLDVKFQKGIMAGVFLLSAVLAQFALLPVLVIRAFNCSYLTFLVGIYLRELRLTKLDNPIFAFVSFLALLFISRFHYIDLANALIDNVFSYITGLLFSWWMLKPLAEFITTRDRLCRMLCYIGKHTVPVVCLHILAFKLVTWLYIITHGLPKLYLASFHLYFDTSEPWKLLYVLAGVTIPLLLRAIADHFTSKYFKKQKTQVMPPEQIYRQP